MASDNFILAFGKNMIDLSSLREANDNIVKQEQADKQAQIDATVSSQRHDEILDSSVRIQNTVLTATESLIRYLEGHTSKTEVVNQLTHIGTPDALKVVQAVNQLHETLKTHKNTDLTEVTKVMTSILDEAKKIPKELPKTEKQQFVDYTKQFSTLTNAISSLEKSVKAQDLHVDAPVINTEQVNLKPFQDAIIKAISTKKIPIQDLPFTKNKKPIKVELVDNAVPTSQTNLFINERFDSWKLVYDDFNDDNDLPQQIQYFYKGKKVATIKFGYDKKGRAISGKKV